MIFNFSRDCVPLFYGDAYPVRASASMLAQGWRGGQGVRWVDPEPDAPAEFTVGLSDGSYGGFVLTGSNEEADQLTALTGTALASRCVMFCAGGWVLATTTFEQFTWTSRQGGPLVPLVYEEGERLLLSNRGYWTKEDEWTLAGDARAPNAYYLAGVIKVPSLATQGRLIIQTGI